MSIKQNKVDSNYVGKRVEQTKKEIAQLKLELQKLINRGIDGDKNDINTNFEEIQINKLCTTKNPVVLHSNASKNCNIIQRTSSTLLPKAKHKNENKTRDISPKKVRHYNVEEAREYMKKQKEKRFEKMKLQLKASQNVIDTRKEKLKELQKKSLELVQKNINLKRGRSHSREKRLLPEKSSQHEIEKSLTPLNTNMNLENNCILSNNSEKNDPTVPDLIVNNFKIVPSICSNKTQNIETEIYSKDIHIKNNVNDEFGNFDGSLKMYGEIHHKAATKIQSYYKSYYQRKLFRETITRKKYTKSISKYVKPIANNIEQLKESLNDEASKPDIPFWLQTVVQPYPYNFISAVKKKLNLAVNTPIKTSSDIGIQISVEEPKDVKTNKTRNEIKKALKESAKIIDSTSFISHKCLDLNLKNIEKLHLCDDSSQNAGNDCDIEKQSDCLLKKITHSINKPSHLLQSETSESDTSKNIPDISSESSISILHSKNNITDTSDYKLGINIEKFKNLKLQENKVDVMEDTMQILNDEPFKEDKIILNELPQIAEYTDSINNRKLSENRQTVTESHMSPKSKSISDILENKQIKSNSIKSKSVNNIPSQKTNKFENKISNMTDNDKSICNDSASQKMNNLKENIVSSILNQEKANKSLSTEVESDENLKSFLEYMTSLEESKKSRKSSHKKNSSTKSSNSFKSLLTKSPKTSELMNNSTKTEKRNSTENYSSNFSNSISTTNSSVPLLKRPSVTLTTSQNVDLQEENRNSISIKPGEIKCIETKTNTNQIHLKFEAELHLLNDFNESLRQFMAVEKSLLELQNKSQHNITLYQNQDTQTTVPFQQTSLKGSDNTVMSEMVKSQMSQNTIPTINYSRGSDIYENNNFTANDDKSIITTGLEFSHLNESLNSTIDISASNISLPANDITFNNNIYVGFSVGMFDQLIKDEDARIENLKTILKIREKALLDRTKGELAWLEIQKKHLIETGQLHEASLLKKKQRGIIIKLQHEKQEMQRLKQIQKAASKERKTILKEQRNMIKSQLSNNNIVPKIKRSIHKGRRSCGPIKVYNLHRETINTETSISRRSSVAEEIIITSRSESIVGQISEESVEDRDNNSIILNHSFKSALSNRNEETKKSLLMREAALQKRKKAAEDLLQWHQRLLEEEKKIIELEMAANTLIKQAPVHSVDNWPKAKDEKYNFKGSQLNMLWTNLTGKNERKFKDEETYFLSEIALEKFCEDAKINSYRQNKFIEDNRNNNKKSDTHTNYSSNNSSESKKLEISDKSTNEYMKGEYKNSSSSNNLEINNDTYNYSSEFDSPEIIEEHIDSNKQVDSNTSNLNSSIHTELLVNEIDKSKSTLNEIMQNISNITDEISAIYKLSAVANETTPSILITNSNNDTAKAKITSNDLSNERCIETVDTLHRDESDEGTLKSSVQSEIVKSLTELISSQNPCQDIKFVQKHNIIETPEFVCSKNIHTDSQGTLTSNIELCTNSIDVENEINEFKDNEKSNNLNSNLNEEQISEHLFENNFKGSNSGDNNDVVGSENIKCCVISEDFQNKNNKSEFSDMCSVKSSSNIIKDISNSDESQHSESISNIIDNILDLSYGFTGTRVKDTELLLTISESKNHSTENNTNTSCNISTENENDNLNVKSSENDTCKIKDSVDVISSIISNKTFKNISEIKDDSTAKLNIKGNCEPFKLNDVIDDINTSVEETTISTESNFEKSVFVDELKSVGNGKTVDNICINTSYQECESSNITKPSSQIEVSDFINNNESLTIEDIADKSIYENKSKNISEEVNTNNLPIPFTSDINIKTTVNSEFNNINLVETGVSNSELNNNIDVKREFAEEHVNTSTLCNKNKATSPNALDKLPNNRIKECTMKISEKDECNNEADIIQEHKLNKQTDILTKGNNNTVLDVKKRVSEILIDAVVLKEVKSPRLQDIYTTTYDILPPDHSPKISSPGNSDKDIASVTQLFDEEAEALFKKQLAIEQEIKQLEQQQKEQIPYIYMREIPNKPPPPYTPPVSQAHVISVLPSSQEQVDTLTLNIAERLYKAYENGNLENMAANFEDMKSLTNIHVDKECYEFVFDLCKEFALEHYTQFIQKTGPSWMIVNKKPLAKQKPLDRNDLKVHLLKKIKDVLGFEKVIYKENMITKWSRKKRDHVDEILIIESQTEESEWTNYDDDEIIVKNELTNDIMNMLLTETANVIGNAFAKKMNLF